MVDVWLKEGIIQPSKSPWASPAFFVPKSDGGLRLVVDYRALNSVCVPSSYPLPTAESLFGRLHNACIFSKFDAHTGFHQMKMSKRSIPLTAFVVPFGCYEYTRMSMGLASAPSSFQKAIPDDDGHMFFYRREISEFTKQENLALIIPRSDHVYQQAIFHACHSTAGHQKTGKTLDLLRRCKGNQLRPVLRRPS